MALTVKFNGYDFSKKFIIADVKRPFPEFRASSTQIDGADGEWLDAMTVGARECSFALVAKANTAQELQYLARELARVLLMREPENLTFSDELDPNDKKTQLVRKAVPDGVFDFEEFIKAGRWTCHFKMPDPYLYRKEKTSKLIKASKQLTFEVGGNAPAANVVATATPPNGKTSYQLVTSDAHLVYKANFTGAQTVKFDFDRQTAKVTGNIGDGLTTGSSFFVLDGTMTIKSVNADTTITYYERWL
jgi:predicted phage tail component-like protein